MAKADYSKLELPEAADLALEELKATDRMSSAVRTAVLARRLRQRGFPGRERAIMEGLHKLARTQWGFARSAYIGGPDPLSQYEWSLPQQR